MKPSNSMPGLKTPSGCANSNCTVYSHVLLHVPYLQHLCQARRQHGRDLPQFKYYFHGKISKMLKKKVDISKMPFTNCYAFTSYEYFSKLAIKVGNTHLSDFRY